MHAADIAIPGIETPALLRTPSDDNVRGGVVLLHPAYSGHRDQALFAHAATTLTALGYAVLSYDRRSQPEGGDVPFTAQAADAELALEALVERYGVPAGIWAYSQGTWAAPLAAAGNHQVAYLALLGCPGVSPAEQMRFHCAELMRRAGFGPDEQHEMLRLRSAMEDLVRAGNREHNPAMRDDAEAMLRVAREKEWFHFTYLPAELPSQLPPWADMDFDPAPVIAQVRCPVLLIYGADEECVPVAVSERVWRHGAETAGADLEVVKVPGIGHWPGPLAPGREPPAAGESADIDSGYTQALTDWFARRLAA